MSNKSLFSLAFIIGAATGSVVTWYLLKDKYEALAQEEIDSVKEVFLRREQELKDQSVKKTVAEGIKDTDKEKPDLKEYAERLKKEGYTRYSDFGSDEEEKPVSEAGPYVIPPEQFGDDEEYEQISLTYYADGVLADENDEVIEDVEDAVGIDSLIKNKIYGIIFIILGALTIPIEWDATFFLFALMVGILLFASRENCIMD